MRILPYIPSFYEDEDFRSWVYRYHIHCGNKEFNQTNIELFNTNSYKNAHLPRNLSAFFVRLPKDHGLSIDKILHDHTLWPLIRPFISHRQIDQVMTEVLYGSSGSRANFAQRQLTNHHGRVLSSSIRYCPYCVVDDYQKYGECYIHRSHQIDQIDICHVHQSMLITHCPVCGILLANNDVGLHFLIAPQCPNGHILQLSPVDGVKNFPVQSKLELYNDFQVIINGSKDINRNDILRRLELYMFRGGYIHLSGKPRKGLLSKDIKNAILNTDINGIGELLSVEEGLREIRSIFQQGHNSPNLIFYVFLMKFVAGTVGSFFHERVSVNVPLPFGCGPWECVNRVCPHYCEPVINSCSRRTLVGNTVSGRFSCPTCGCTYHIKWEWETPSSVTKRRIVAMGWLWEETLAELHQQGLSMSQISKQMKTTYRHVEIGLNRLRGSDKSHLDNVAQHAEGSRAAEELAAGLAETAASIDPNSRLGIHRHRVMSLLQSNPDLMRQDISKLAQGAYAWLMKHDRQWLDQILPRKAYGPKLDWDQIDEDLKVKVNLAAYRLVAQDHLKRITRSTIINQLETEDRFRLSRGQDLLPKAWDALMKCEETKEDYLVRHVPSIVNQLLQSGYKNVTLNSILAFRRSYRGCPGEVRSRIITVLDEMGFENTEHGMGRYVVSEQKR